MRRSLVMLLAPIIVALLSFLPSAVGTVMQKPDTQILNLTPSSPIYARSPMSAKQLAFVPASTTYLRVNGTVFRSTTLLIDRVYANGPGGSALRE